MNTSQLRARLLLVMSLPLLGALPAGCKKDPGKGADSAHDDSDAPWAAEIAKPGPGSQSARQCFPRARVAQAQSQPFDACPTTGRLVELGLYSPPPAPPPGHMAMTGENMTEGPVTWKDQCCYLVVHWHTGRALPVEGVVRASALQPRRDWGALPVTARN